MMDEGVLFHCYKCEVDMVRIEDRDGKPAYQCPNCQEIANFQIPNVGVVKVSALQGRAKLIAKAEGLDPDDLVILTISLEKVIGDPVSYLLSKLQSPEEDGE